MRYKKYSLIDSTVYQLYDHCMLCPLPIFLRASQTESVCSVCLLPLEFFPVKASLQVSVFLLVTCVEVLFCGVVSWGMFR